MGWIDVDLLENGLSEVREVGVILKKNGYIFDVVYILVLKCVIWMLWIVFYEMDFIWVLIYKFWKLNERYYGVL